MVSVSYTPTESRLLERLSDGMPHGKWDLLTLLPDDMAGLNALQVMICKLRKKLPAGHAIICENNNKRISYRHVLLLRQPSED